MTDVLSRAARRELEDNGFAVIPGPVPVDRLTSLIAAYDAAVQSADALDVSVGRTTTRVTDFVNRGPEFDPLYVYAPVLEACALLIGGPYRLSTLHARTLRPRSPAQDLHVDFARDDSWWPMVGFIFMVDDFRSDNGATRFVPGSHRAADRAEEVVACGPAGSMIVYNGSVRHGHSANVTEAPRRSIQGAYIRRDAPSGVDLAARMRPETLARIGPLGRQVLAL